MKCGRIWQIIVASSDCDEIYTIGKEYQYWQCVEGPDSTTLSICPNVSIYVVSGCVIAEYQLERACGKAIQLYTIFPSAVVSVGFQNLHRYIAESISGEFERSGSGPTTPHDAKSLL